ncbi:MAG: hypothetical protein WBA48_07180 [Xanthobacteraceae bacterium]
MTSQSTVAKLLTDQIVDPDTQWSLGTFGAIAEFARDRDEPVALTATGDDVAAVTARGGIAIRVHEDMRPFASESLAKQHWNHRVAICLPEDACAMSRRGVLTELGADTEALREQDRDGVLFDLGLGAPQADLCIRVADPHVAGELRNHVGRAVFEPGNPAMGVILAANPHRVFISRIGRAEVYQPIPPHDGKSPEGPHTHVLPKLLKSGRTHPATEPIPEGFVPCAHFYPAHPAKDALGQARAFERSLHEAFQRLLAELGAPESAAFKRDVVAAVGRGEPPWTEARIAGRGARANVRIALRQMKAAGDASPVLTAWLAAFDRAEPSDDEADDLTRGHAD